MVEPPLAPSVNQSRCLQNRIFDNWEVLPNQLVVHASGCVNASGWIVGYPDISTRSFRVAGDSTEFSQTSLAGQAQFTAIY
jgi:hypothetical protein